jgi:putative acetyltransferase
MANDITQDENYDIRYSRVTDISYLKKWMIDPRILQYLPFDYHQSQELEYFAKNWIGFSRYQASLTAVYNAHPCGIGTLFLMPYRKVAHMAMMYIVVDPLWQRKGIGSSLLKNLMHHARNHFKLELLNIEIMDNNPILSILKKNGFYEVFRQEKYFKVNGKYHARILMEVVL